MALANPWGLLHLAYLKRDWLTPLVQLVTNVMVSSPEQSDRSLALASLRSLFGKVVLNDRYVVRFALYWCALCVAC